jgi:hypothetical protein
MMTTTTRRWNLGQLKVKDPKKLTPTKRLRVAMKVVRRAYGNARLHYTKSGQWEIVSRIGKWEATARPASGEFRDPDEAWYDAEARVVANRAPWLKKLDEHI